MYECLHVSMCTVCSWRPEGATGYLGATWVSAKAKSSQCSNTRSYLPSSNINPLCRKRQATDNTPKTFGTRGSAQIPRTLAVLLLLKAVTSQHHKPLQHQVQGHPWHTEFKTSLSRTRLSQDT